MRGVRRLIVFGGCLFGLAVVPATVGGGQALSAAPAPATVRHALLKGFEPWQMALASDGGVWVTDVVQGVTRVDVSGRRQVFLKDDQEIRQLAPGANGAIWASGVG